MQEDHLNQRVPLLRSSSFIDELLLDAERSSKYASEFAQHIGLFCIIAFPLSFLIERYLAPEMHNTLQIRVVAALGCTGLIFYTQLRAFSSTLASTYWVLIVGFAGVYTFSTMLILNAAYSPENSDHLSIWVFQYLAALFVVVQALSSWRLLIPVWLLATTASMTHLVWVDDPNWEAIKTHVIFPAPIFLTSLVFGTLLIRFTKIVQIEKLDTASAIGATVAHEIRTPLAAIRGFSSGIANNFSELTRVYQEAQKSEAIETSITEEKLGRINSALTSIKEEVDYSNTVIDMLLISTAGLDFVDFSNESCQAFDCVEASIERFPYANDVERNMIEVNYVENFRIPAPSLIVVHVLFNLLKNAIRHSYNSTDRRVTISVGSTKSENVIFVKDSGKGISQSMKIRIFERFYTTQSLGEGAGIGLSFCQSAMKKMGGTITCESDSASYSLFALRFNKTHSEP